MNPSDLIFILALTAFALSALPTAAAVYFYRVARRWKRSHFINGILPVRVAVYNRDGAILYFHREHGVNTTLAKEEYHHINELPWVKPQYTLDCIRHVCDTGKTMTWDYDFFGERRSVTFSRLEKSMFGKTAVISVSGDSSNLQSARDEAEANARRLSLTLQSIGDAVIVTDSEEKIRLMNPVAVRLTGHAADQALEKPLDSVFRITDANGIFLESPVRTVLSTGSSIGFHDCAELISKSGTRYRVANSASPIRNENGLVIGSILVFRDVSEEYEKQDKLNLSVSMLRRIAEQSNISYFRMELDSGEIQVIFSGKKRLRPIVDGQPIPLKEWFLKEDYEKIQQCMTEIRNGKISNFELELRGHHGKSLRYYTLFASSWSPERGEIAGLIRDITFEVESRNFHEDTFHLLNLMKNSIPHPIFLKDADNGFRYYDCNTAFAERIGKTPNKIIGKTDFEIYSPADAEAARESDLETIRRGVPYEFQEKYQNADGEFRCYHMYKQIIASRNGTRLILGIAMDVTNEERSSEQLRSREAFFQQLIDNLPICLNVTEPSSQKEILANKAFREQAEYEREVKSAPRTAVFENAARETNIETFVCPGKEPKICTVLQIPVELNGKTLRLEAREDITEFTVLRKQYETTLSSLETHSRNAELVNNCLRFITMRSDFREAVTGILKLCVGSAGAGKGFVYRGDKELFAKEFEWSPDGSPLPENYRAEDLQPWLKRFRAGKPVIFTDSLNPPEGLESSADILHAAGVKAMLAVGIPLQGGLYGFLGFAWSAPCPVTDSDVQTLSEAVNLFQLAYEREIRLDGKKGLYSEFFETFPLPITVLDSERRVMALNTPMRVLFADKNTFEPGNFCYSKGGCRLHGSSYCTPRDCCLWYSITTGKPTSRDYELNGKTIQIHANPVFDANGRLKFVGEYVISRSENKVAKKATVIFPRHLEFIMKCAEELSCGDSPAAILDKITETASTFFSAEVSLMLPTLSEDKSVIYVRKDHPANPKTIREADFPALFHELKTNGSVEFILASVPVSCLHPWQKDADAYLRNSGLSEMVLLSVPQTKKADGYLSLKRDFAEPDSSDITQHVLQFLSRGIALLLERMDEEAPKNDPSPVLPAPPPLQGKTVLLVDDMPMNLKVLSALMKKLGYESVAFSSAPEALKYLKNHSAALILTDLWMPEMNGVEFAQSVRVIPNGGELRIVAVTADTECSRNFDLSCFDKILVKPVTFAVLKDFLSRPRSQ